MILAELATPEQEIESLKTAFQFFIQEGVSVIAGLTVYTLGYLTAELEDDEIIGPRWKTSQEARRLNIKVITHLRI